MSGHPIPCAASPAEHGAKLQALRAALIDGENSGPPTPFDFDAFIAEKRQGAAAGS